MPQEVRFSLVFVYHVELANCFTLSQKSSTKIYGTWLLTFLDNKESHKNWTWIWGRGEKQEEFQEMGSDHEEYPCYRLTERHFTHNNQVDKKTWSLKVNDFLSI